MSLSNIKELFTKNLLLLINSMVFSEFGNIIYSTALNFWILYITNSTALIGWISIICVLPQLILSPFIGIYIDKHNKKNIIVFTDIIRGISMCLFGIITLFKINNTGLILINSLILAVSTCFYQTSINASSIYIFPQEKFVESNSITNSIINISEVCASSLSGILLSIFSAPILFIINGITFFISGISGFFMHIPNIKTSSNKDDNLTNIKDEMKTCFNLVKKNTKLINLILTRCILGLLLQLNIVLIIPLFNQNFSEVLYGFSNSAKIAGTLLGSLFLIYLKKYLSENKIILITIMSLCAAFILLSNTNNMYLTFISMFIFGFSFNMYNILTESNIVLLVPKEHRAKALAIIFQLIFFFMGIGSLIGGLMGDHFSIQTILTLNSIIILVIYIIFYLKRMTIKAETSGDIIE